MLKESVPAGRVHPAGGDAAASQQGERHRRALDADRCPRHPHCVARHRYRRRRDPLGSLTALLSLFTYTWWVEVQVGPEAGRTVPGLWSEPSAPVSWKVVPKPPVLVTPGTAVMGMAGVEVRFTSTDLLDAAGEGTYVLDVFRVTPAGSPLKSGAVGSYAAGTRRQPDGFYMIEDNASSVPLEPPTWSRCRIPSAGAANACRLPRSDRHDRDQRVGLP